MIELVERKWKEVKLLQAEQSLTLAFSQGGLTFLGLSVTCICWLWSKASPQLNSPTSKTIYKYITRQLTWWRIKQEVADVASD